MSKTEIEWTDYTFNPWIGCTKISKGCKYCYAETIAKRFNFANWGKGNNRRLASDTQWEDPKKWDRKAEKEGKRYKVFSASMSDIYDPEVPDQWRARLYNLIQNTPNLDWLILTKRPEYLLEYEAKFITNLPGNMWIGVSVEDQETANKRIPLLLKINSNIRFLSIEPLLGQIDLRKHLHFPECPKHPLNKIYSSMECDCREYQNKVNAGINWVITGGESGQNARKPDPEWFLYLKDQCLDAKIPFFFKQWGSWSNEGKKKSKKTNGNLLNGRLYNEFPGVIKIASNQL